MSRLAKCRTDSQFKEQITLSTGVFRNLGQYVRWSKYSVKSIDKCNQELSNDNLDSKMNRS